MLKKIGYMLIGALLCAMGGALANAYTVGNVPLDGFQMPDGTWLKGLANGYNYSYVSGISAAGTSQTTATALPSNIYMIEVDTVSSSTGVNVPPCYAGRQFTLYNNGSNNLAVYPAVANNPLTGAQDTINNTTSYTLNSHVGVAFACAKNGVWAAS